MFSVPILYSRLAKKPAEKQLTTRELSLQLFDNGVFRLKTFQGASYCHGLIKKCNNAKRFTTIFKYKRSEKHSKGPQQLIPFGRGDPDLTHTLDRDSCHCYYGKNFIESMEFEQACRRLL